MKTVMLMSKMHTGEDVTTAMIQMYLMTTLRMTFLLLGNENCDADVKDVHW